jgi:hypothetical protein
VWLTQHGKIAIIPNWYHTIELCSGRLGLYKIATKGHVMAFNYEWTDDSKRVLRYRVEGDWNWRDYHHVVQVSTFSLYGVEHPVDCLIDLRGSTRPKLPSGLLGHVRSFGAKKHPRFTGRALVIGMPPEGIELLQLLEDNTLPTADGFVKFVNTEDEMQSVLADWVEHSPS